MGVPFSYEQDVPQTAIYSTAGRPCCPPPTFHNRSKNTLLNTPATPATPADAASKHHPAHLGPSTFVGTRSQRCRRMFLSTRAVCPGPVRVCIIRHCLGHPGMTHPLSSRSAKTACPAGAEAIDQRACPRCMLQGSRLMLGCHKWPRLGGSSQTCMQGRSSAAKAAAHRGP